MASFVCMYNFAARHYSGHLLGNGNNMSTYFILLIVQLVSSFLCDIFNLYPFFYRSFKTISFCLPYYFYSRVCTKLKPSGYRGQVVLGCCSGQKAEKKLRGKQEKGTGCSLQCKNSIGRAGVVRLGLCARYIWRLSEGFGLLKTVLDRSLQSSEPLLS